MFSPVGLDHEAGTEGRCHDQRAPGWTRDRTAGEGRSALRQRGGGISPMLRVGCGRSCPDTICVREHERGRGRWRVTIRATSASE
jgi:hypothetical protein